MLSNFSLIHSYQKTFSMELIFQLLVARKTTDDEQITIAASN